LTVGYNRGMASESGPRRSRKSPPPGDTGQEAAYLRFLSDKQVPVTVKLRDGESVSGWIEYFDDRMIRLTREGRPNLFIYKQQIRTITEQGRRGPKNDTARSASDETKEMHRD
jgi:host factor-I protein